MTGMHRREFLGATGALVAGQLAVLDGWDGEVALVYRVLGRVALELSRRLGAASDRDLVSLEELFAKNG